MRGLETLNKELDSLTASEAQRSALQANPIRGLAAIQEARKRGATDIARYATAVFHNSSWAPKQIEPPTNRSVVVDCQLCGGDRVVLVKDYDPKVLYDEVYRRCPSCNAGQA
jgi:hypothetical protein